MSIHRFIPPAGIAVAGVTLATTGLVSAATTGPRAVAAAGTTACAGSQTVAYSPGLSTRPRAITVHGTSTLGRCVSSADPAITGGKSTFKATGRLSCTSGDYSGTRKVTWNNGRTSTMTFRSVVSVSAGQSIVTIKGTVTDGEFSGRKWSAIFTMFARRPAACLTPAGLPTASGRLLLDVGSLVPGRTPEKAGPLQR
ncbi:hypothetical protein [Actinomadura sp. DC4]|uniref:hypothetical protein n=1 Tax=Actinomadura sp. DC4 TaxID=3055069 RepID=UPI0025B1663D|nr:hypothetical protein [Actinomadura sp. DC4]MDN3352085.1 hypothetical protein [Actinomadura sp. DC4]